jgi:predicted nucleic acid-binding protein
MILLDTNILIEFYKDNPTIRRALETQGVPNLAISVITAGELYFGARDKREMRKIEKHLSMLEQIPLDAEITDLFLNLLREYALSHRLNIPDALIAATAIQNKLPIYTLNTKDFQYIPGLELYQP